MKELLDLSGRATVDDSGRSRGRSGTLFSRGSSREGAAVTLAAFLLLFLVPFLGGFDGSRAQAVDAPSLGKGIEPCRTLVVGERSVEAARSSETAMVEASSRRVFHVQKGLPGGPRRWFSGLLVPEDDQETFRKEVARTGRGSIPAPETTYRSGARTPPAPRPTLLL